MRLAFFSPLPPAKSGIADYSAALLGPLAKQAEVDVFSAAPGTFDPSRYDAIVYQLGNNPDHSFVYDYALRYPGTVVMHEANLHHLIAHRTIGAQDWDGYLHELAFDGGERARRFGERVRRLEVGPDYEGVPMLRRVLAASEGAIAHSRFVAAQLVDNGFAGRIGVIPHGVWLPEIDRHGYRHKLGVDLKAPLIGTFGHLKPYKRIAESLRAFRRLVQLIPEAKFILVGEPHPELRLDDLVMRLGLEAHVRHIGYAPIDDFTGYLAACDVVLNLRYPTVGETSGTLHRSLGLGRAVLVSDVGAFSEYPDDICLKVPVGAGEEDLIFEYLNLLCSQPGMARGMGERARAWVQRECPWEVVAGRYLGFLQGDSRDAFVPRAAPPFDAEPSGTEVALQAETSATIAHGSTAPSAEPVPVSAITTWTNPQPEVADYVDTHLTRFQRTLELTPPGGPDDHVLEMGAYMMITAALKHQLGYGHVRGCYYGTPGHVDVKTIESEDGRAFTCEIDHFDAEKHTYPYPDGHFATVLCCELIEHLPNDPMHTMSEINRILRPGGHLVLTTPNIASLRSIAAMLNGYHPALFPAYLHPQAIAKGESRHHREYTAKEVYLLLHYAGFTITQIDTGPFKQQPRPELAWVTHLLEQYGFPQDLRGEGVYCVGRKDGPVRDRYPDWLYT